MECARTPQIPRKKGSSRNLGGSKQGLRRSPKSCTRKEHESATNSIAKRGQGAMPLAGSRDSVPCGVWGSAPTVPRQTYSKEEINKGAGSEASLPVTLRVRRRAPQAALPPSFREKPKKRTPFAFGRECAPFVNQPSGLISVISKNSAVSLPLTLSTFSSSSSVTCWSTMRAPAVM